MFSKKLNQGNRISCFLKCFTFLIHLCAVRCVCAEDNCIVNFGEQFCGGFTLTDSIIVKSSLNKKTLEEKLQKNLIQIAFLKQANLYLLKSAQPLMDSGKLTELTYIDYAQPDIIQKRYQAGFNSNQSMIENALILKGRNLGTGVNIAIIDDGFFLEHEDLKGVDTKFSYDADDKDLDASNKLQGDNHGTMVAGIIFGRHNDIGIDGLAPAASLIAIRQPLNRTSNSVVSFTVAAMAGAQIINCSWNSPLLMEPVFDVITNIALNGRDGKGVAVVFAAGNNARRLQKLSVEAAIPEVITVGTNKPYSNFGDLVDVIVPTGFISTAANGKYRKFGGTSAAAAYVSGMLALELQQNAELNVEQLLSNAREQIHAIH